VSDDDGLKGFAKQLSLLAALTVAALIVVFLAFILAGCGSGHTYDPQMQLGLCPEHFHWGTVQVPNANRTVYACFRGDHA